MISDDHLKMLAASGITPEHAALRGYETVTDRGRLANLDGNGHGVAEDGRNVPGLLVPMLRVDGSTWGHQYRPDNPRLRNGKPIKYETPWQQRNGLDIPPGVGDRLGDPAVPLFIAEGVKKADCGALHGTQRHSSHRPPQPRSARGATSTNTSPSAPKSVLWSANSGRCQRHGN